MAKRFNTERKVNKDGFKIKIGTTNRLNPNTVYVDLGGYIIPQENKEEYTEEFNMINKFFNKKLKTLLNKDIFDTQYICVIDTAHERMKKDKESYLSLQCHLKQTGTYNTDDILNKTEELANILTNELIDIVEDYGFLVKK